MYAITGPQETGYRDVRRPRKTITAPNAAYWGAVCGLLAFVAAPALLTAGTGGAAHADSAIARASHLMRHRGPDEPGTWIDPSIEDGLGGGPVFGFNRLSIIDIEHSHQPLRWGPPDAPDRYVLVFNGEIYNYLELRDELSTQHGAVFATDGDGEAIVAGYHYWGTEVLKRLRGMFAFALWDTLTRELFCARDPFGIKPLFMATGTGGTAVASEKKCLLDLADLVGFDSRIDPRAVQHYTVLQYVPEPETLHRGVRRLESGCYARIRPGLKPEVTRYFVPRFAVTPIAAGTEQSRYDEITAVLEDSVAKHMRADVTVGAFLSGGIDSTAIAALAIRHNPRLITFTTGFEREGFSEIDVAVASAEAIGARHIAKVVHPDEFVAALPEIVWYLDEPVADPALVPLFFVAREARKHVKVVLSGEGADELFGGYTIYREPLSLKPFDYLPRPLRRSMRKVSQAAAGGHARQEPAAPWVADARGALLRQCPQLLRRAVARRAAGIPRGLDPHRCDGAAVCRVDRLGSSGPHAAHRPVHLAARRHSGQGRQDDDGQLPGAAGAVPGSRGVRGGRPATRTGQDHPHHHEIRAAARPGAHRAGACAAPAQARVPRPDPALAARRRTAGVGLRNGGLVAGR